MKFRTPEFEQHRQSDGCFYYLYKITNKLNQKFYYGVHSTHDLGDGYMGSGSVLNKAYKRYGKKNFIKEILEFFTGAGEMFAREGELVNGDLIKNPQCYNVNVGGYGGHKNKIIAKSKKTGQIVVLDKNSIEWLSGDYTHLATGTINVYDKNLNKCHRIPKDEFNPDIHEIPNKGTIVMRNIKTGQNESVKINDPRRQTGELIPTSFGKTTIRHIKTQTYIQVSNPLDYIKTGEYEYMNTGKWTLRNKVTGKCIQVPKGSDVDWKVYEMSTCRKNKKSELNCTWAKTIFAKKYSLYWNNDTRLQSGELILRRDGTAAGRIYVNNGKMSRSVHRMDVDKFLKFHNDWVIGNLPRK